MALKAKIFPCPNKRMKGVELKRLFDESGITWDEFLKRFFFWEHHTQIKRHIDLDEFELAPVEMQELLDVFSATSL